MTASTAVTTIAANPGIGNDGNSNPVAMETPITVLQDSGNKVILSIQVPGLKKRHSLWKALTSIFHKTSNPFRLSSNAKFGAYSLTSTSLDFTVDVYEDKKAMKKVGNGGGSEVRQRYICRIQQFPSKINPQSAEFELLEGVSGDCYFMLTCVKTDNYSTNWKEYFATHATLDATQA